MAGIGTGITGPDQIHIDLVELRRLAATGAIQTEIAAHFGISVATLIRRINEYPAYAEAARKGRTELCISLRTKQVEMALAGDRTMLIWLGKQLLGQKDSITVAGDSAHPLELTVTSAAQIIASRITQLAERNRSEAITIDVNGLPS